MLASLLPGLREIRTPLVAGYIWLVTVWLAVERNIPNRQQAHGHLRQLYILTDFFGKSIILTVITFLAYLLGTLLQVRALSVLRPILRYRVRRQKDIHGRDSLEELSSSRGLLGWRLLLTGPASDTLTRYVHTRIQQAVPESAGKWLRVESFRAKEILTSDLDQVRTRLFAANADLYGESDRKASEADLRANVAAAGGTLSVVLAWKVDPLWLLLLPVSGILLVRAVSLARQANDMLVQAVVTELVRSPQLEQYLEEVQEQQKQESQPGQ
ncbi:hypothetical protein AB0K89_13805 [Streptomyces cinnamoneus]|uniref:hypothetical protein n=1 Tax=Streptomyces cinnamoneus TaxID=53446 RepID=UPI003415198B